MVLGPQFRFVLQPPETVGDDAIIEAHHTANNDWAGTLQWGEKKVQEVDVASKYGRQGLATEMWKRAQQAHKDAPYHFPEPRPSNTRTREGDEWAWSLHRKGLSPEPPHNEWDDDIDD